MCVCVSVELLFCWWLRNINLIWSFSSFILFFSFDCGMVFETCEVFGVDLHIYFYRFHVRVPTVIAMSQKKCVILYCCCKLDWCLRMSVENEIDNNLNFDPIEQESCASPIKEFIIFEYFWFLVFVRRLCKRNHKCDRSHTQFVIHLYYLLRYSAYRNRRINVSFTYRSATIHFAAKISGTEYLSIQYLFIPSLVCGSHR